MTTPSATDALKSRLAAANSADAAVNANAAAAVAQQQPTALTPNSALGAQGSNVLDLSSETKLQTQGAQDAIPQRQDRELDYDPRTEVRIANRPAGREFQHVYAGANTIMPDGGVITFGGAPGQVGRHITNDHDKITYLEKLSKMPGSQITEIVRDTEGREVPMGSVDAYYADLRRAQTDASENTRLDSDPAVATARSNLANNIKVNG